MPALLQAVVVVGCVVAGLRLRPAAALVLLTAVVVLLPGGLHLPNGVTSLPTATRLTALAIAIGLRRQAGLWRSTPMTTAAAAYALLTLVTGVLLAEPQLQLSSLLDAWVGVLDPLLVGLVALACARAAGSRAVVIALGAVAVLAVAAGLVEHVVGSSLADRLVGSGRLETRAGETRVRVGSDFALAYAWTIAALVPAVVALLRQRLGLALLGLAGCALAAYWTFSRSVPLGVALGLLVLLVGLRDRRVVAVFLVAALGLASAALVPSVRHRFSTAVDQGAVDVRFQRAPVVLEAVSHRPVTGLGLGGVAALHVGETDESFLLAYADTGVLGAVALIGVLLCGLILVGRGLRGPPSPGRTAATVSLAGAAVLVLSGTAFDAFAVRGTAALLGLLLGVGIAAAENVAGPAPRVSPRLDLPVARLALVVLAVTAGLLVSQLAPRHSAVTARFTTLSQSELSASYELIDEGRRRVATTCAVVTAAHLAGISVGCVDTYGAAGEGVLRLEASRPDQLGPSLYALVSLVRTHTTLDTLNVVPVLPIRSGASSGLTTAPWWAGLAALLLVLLTPSEPLRRLHTRSRRWTWTVDRGDRSPRPERLVGPTVRVG